MIEDKGNGQNRSTTVIVKELSAGALSCMIASAATNPLDVVKTRLQAQMKMASSSGLGSTELGYDRFFSATLKIAREEGVYRGLVVPGMSAALLRETAYSSIRFGLYSRMKVIISGENRNPSILEKMAAGMCTGAIGSALANPTDLVKIRLQAEAGRVNRETGLYETGLRKGYKPTYRSTANAFLEIYRQDGIVRGLYRGAAATSLRAALLTGGQLSSYEQSKIFFKSEGILREGFQLHVICSVISSFVAATVCAPADLIKTRLLGDYTTLGKAPGPTDHQHVQRYRGIPDCFYQTIRNEGLRGLYRGWLPSWLRLAPHFIISMPAYEQIRILFGLNHL